MASGSFLRTEARALATIATPIVVAEIGWMSMGLVDTMMVGPLGPAAIAATGVGGSVFTAVAIFGMGLMLGLDTLVSQAFGAGRLDECRRLLHQGLWLALFITPVVMLVNGLALASMDGWGLNPDIGALAVPYLEMMTLSAPPLLLYAALRRYLLGVHVVRPIMITLITANVVNVCANWALIYGRLGLPAMGVRGSALATVIARVYMAGMLWLVVRWVKRGSPDMGAIPLGIDTPRLRQLLALGIPAASQITLEVGAFALATGLAAKLDAVSSAAHQIALNVASLTYMVPLGLCSAAAVRVGHARGARHAGRAVAAGWAAIAIALAMAVLMGLAMALVPEPILLVFSRDARVIEIGAGLLAIAAAFQLFDGTQAVATGALRGLGETVVPMLINLLAYWVLGLPLGYALCFWYGWGVEGLWVGFSLGLIVAAAILLAVWIRRSRALMDTPW